MKHNYFMSKETGELLTYSEMMKAFYSVKRTYLESPFDEYTETDIESDESVMFPDFSNVVSL